MSRHRSPTVVLFAGGFAAGWIWDHALYPTDTLHEEPIDAFSAGRGDPQKLASAVLATASRRTRVCTYDRPDTTLGENIATGRHGEISTPVAQPHSVAHDVVDLHALLDAAGEPGPYVLMAHSRGGLIAERYAGTYPEDVLGRVSADVTSVLLRDTLSRLVGPLPSALGVDPERRAGMGAAQARSLAHAAWARDGQNALGPRLRAAADMWRARDLRRAPATSVDQLSRAAPCGTSSRPPHHRGPGCAAARSSRP